MTLPGVAGERLWGAVPWQLQLSQPPPPLGPLGSSFWLILWRHIRGDLEGFLDDSSDHSTPPRTRDARASCCPPLSTSPCLQHKGGSSRPLLLRHRPRRKPFGLEMARSWLLTWSPRWPLALCLQQPGRLTPHASCLAPGRLPRAHLASGSNSCHTPLRGVLGTRECIRGKDLLSVFWALNSGYQAPPRQLRPR